MKSYRELEVWKLGMDIAEWVIRETRAFPSEERFVMVPQMRRAANSIPFNIAEGWGCDNRGNYLHSLRTANGSLKELETQCLLAGRVEYLQPHQVELIVGMTEREGRMLRGLIRAIERE